jgi:hypothetical protein
MTPTPAQPARQPHPPFRLRHKKMASFVLRTATNPSLPLVATILLALLSTPAHAQGCAQCLDSTRSTPPAVQAAFRHAILLLGSTAATLFLAATLLIRRHR